MMKFGWVIAVLLVVAAAPPASAQTFTGKDAAYIDFAARNCAMKSTPKEHGLVEAARSKGAPTFEKQYMQQAGDKQLAEALSSPARTKSMCEDITAWYGKSGSRIDGLIQPASEPTAAAPASSGTAKRPDSSPGKGGKKKH